MCETYTAIKNMKAQCAALLDEILRMERQIAQGVLSTDKTVFISYAFASENTQDCSQIHSFALSSSSSAPVSK